MTLYVSTTISILINNLKLIRADTESMVHPEETGSKPRLLVFDSGCHDLAFNDSAMYISEFRELFTILEELKHSGMFKVRHSFYCTVLCRTIQFVKIVHALLTSSILSKLI